MRRLICLALTLCAAVLPGSRVAGAEPVRLIFDTDICGDCDDVLAMGMIHALQSRGACDLLAVTVSADHPQAAPLVDALNHFYGRPEIPIGAVKPPGVQAQTEFLHIVDDKDGDAFRYPHTLLKQSDAPDAVAVLRRALAGQPDGSVVIAQVGFSTNLARLVTSPPDAISPLEGRDLVAKKVRLLSIMAGSFQPIDGNDHFTEYNVNQDIASCQALVENWPTEVVWSPFEIGIALEYPHESIERDYGYVTHHPVSAAYIARNPPPHNRPTWDLTSVLYAVHPDRGYFDLSEPGTVVVEKDGFTKFTPSAEGKHRYLILKPDQKPRVLEALVQLSSQPPCVHAETGR